MRKISLFKTCCRGRIGKFIFFLIPVFLLQFAALSSLAQTSRVTGTVKNSKGDPLSKVSVAIKGATGGSTTDPEGRFVIEAPNQKSVVVFSLVGHATKEIVVGNSKTIDIILDETTSSLDEVVVIGYGTQKKRDVTGAISSVTAKSIEEKQPISIFDALMGAAPGVRVMSESGAPGEGGGIISTTNQPNRTTGSLDNKTRRKHSMDNR